jgi:signal peptidase II
MTQRSEHHTSRITNALSIVLAITLLVGCDRITKIIAQRGLQDGPPRSYLMNMVQLQYAENEGAFLGLGSELPKWFRLGFSFLLLVVTFVALIVLLAKAKDIRGFQRGAFTLMLAGGFGNLCDRLLNDGRVVDFMILVVGPLRTGIFNVADMCITFGVVLILADAVWNRKSTVDL